MVDSRSNKQNNMGVMGSVEGCAAARSLLVATVPDDTTTDALTPHQAAAVAACSPPTHT